LEGKFIFRFSETPGNKNLGVVSKEGFFKRGEFDPTGSKPKRAEFSKDVLKVEKSKNNGLKKYSGRVLELMIKAGFSNGEARRVIFDKTNPYVNEFLAYVRDMPGNSIALDSAYEGTGRLAFVRGGVVSVEGPKHLDIMLNWAEFIYPKIKKATKGFDFERIVKPAILGRAPVLYDAVWRIYMSPLDELDDVIVKKIRDELMEIVRLSRELGSVELAVAEIVRKKEEEKKRREEMLRKLREEAERKLKEEILAREKKVMEEKKRLESEKRREEEEAAMLAEEQREEDKYENYNEDGDWSAEVSGLIDDVDRVFRDFSDVQKAVVKMNEKEYADFTESYKNELGDLARKDSWLRSIHPSAVAQISELNRKFASAKSGEEILSVFKTFDKSPLSKAIMSYVGDAYASGKDVSTVKEYAHFYASLVLGTASFYAKDVVLGFSD